MTGLPSTLRITAEPACRGGMAIIVLMSPRRPGEHQSRPQGDLVLRIPSTGTGRMQCHVGMASTTPFVSQQVATGRRVSRPGDVLRKLMVLYSRCALLSLVFAFTC